MLVNFGIRFIGSYVVGVFIVSNFEGSPSLTYIFLGHSWPERWYVPVIE
jgi:hypothetical protein